LRLEKLRAHSHHLGENRTCTLELLELLELEPEPELELEPEPLELGPKPERAHPQFICSILEQDVGVPLHVEQWRGDNPLSVATVWVKVEW
jgi:hypothetical protein